MLPTTIAGQRTRWHGQVFAIGLGGVARDHVIQIGVHALARWHAEDHGQWCVCLEGECFGYQAAVVVDALMAQGRQGEPGPR
jgi:hypothetical protein